MTYRLHLHEGGIVSASLFCDAYHIGSSVMVIYLHSMSLVLYLTSSEGFNYVAHQCLALTQYSKVWLMELPQMAKAIFCEYACVCSPILLTSLVMDEPHFGSFDSLLLLLSVFLVPVHRKRHLKRYK